MRTQKNKLKKNSKSLKMSLIIERQNCTEIFRLQGTPEGLQSNLLLTAGLLLSGQQFLAATYGVLPPVPLLYTTEKNVAPSSR